MGNKKEGDNIRAVQFREKRYVTANRRTNIVKVTLGAPVCSDNRASTERNSGGFRAEQNRT